MKFVTLSSVRPSGRAIMLGAAAVALASAGGGGAMARTDDVEVVTYHVSFRDLDMSTSAGAQQLMRRIKFAAQRVCGDTHTRDLGVWDDIRRCQTQAIDRAVRDADTPTLTALARRSGESVTVAGR